MREESYCGLISWLIAIFTGCWCIALCPVDKRMVQYRGAGRIVKSRPPSSSSPQRHQLLWRIFYFALGCGVVILSIFNYVAGSQ